MQLSGTLVAKAMLGLMALLFLILNIPLAVKIIFLALLGLVFLVVAGVIKSSEKQRQNAMQILGWMIGFSLLVTAGVFTTPYIGYAVVCLVISAGFIYTRYRLGKRIDRLAVEEIRERQQSQATSHGSGVFEEPEEIDQRFPSGEGMWLIDGTATAGDYHKMTIAAPGSGKNACVLIPNLLIEPFGSYFVLDPKGENACITARFQQEQEQRVIILDPWDVQTAIGATHGIKASGFNPFVFLKGEMSQLNENCESIALYLIADIPGDRDPFWRSRARSLVKNLLLHIITGRPVEDHNFWTLYKMLRLDQAAWEELLFDMKENPALDGQISMAAAELAGLTKSADKTLENIKSTAQDATTIFESVQLRRSLDASDFDPYELTQGDRTVYVVLPEARLDTHYTWLRLVVGLCLKACNAKPSGKRVHFMLDEFAILRAMPEVQRAFSFGRGQKTLMWIFAQNLSDLKRIYGEDGMNALIGNSQIRQFFGVNDPYTQRVVSEMLGDTTIETSTDSYSENGGSTSYGNMGRRLMTPEEVGKYEGVIMITPPIKWKAEKVAYFQNRWEGLDPKTPGLAKELREKLERGELPVDWREIFIGQGRADARPRHNRG